MVLRTVSSSRIQSLRGQVEKHGRCAPLSLQYDLDITVNGKNYILRVQMGRKRKIAALQAVQWWHDYNTPGEKGYKLVANRKILSALMVMLLHQYSEEAAFTNSDTDLSQAICTLMEEDQDEGQDEDNEDDDC